MEPKDIGILAGGCAMAIAVIVVLAAMAHMLGLFTVSG